MVELTVFILRLEWVVAWSFVGSSIEKLITVRYPGERDSFIYRYVFECTWCVYRKIYALQ